MPFMETTILLYMIFSENIWCNKDFTFLDNLQSN